MTTTAQTTSPRSSVLLGSAEERLLEAVGEYGLLTADQACRLLFSSGSFRYVQEKLKILADAGYIQRSFLPRASRSGSAPMVYSLAKPGRRHLLKLDTELPMRFRPSEESDHSLLFMQHSLAVNDVLIAAALLSKIYPQEVVIDEVRHERELKRLAVKVEVKRERGIERIAVIPDAWLDIALPLRGERVCLAIELDRGTERQVKWKRKVASLLAFSQGAYQEAYGRQALTIAIITTGGERRRRDLLVWTEQELTSRGLRQEADLFAVTSLVPPESSPAELFLSSSWYTPFSPLPQPLVRLGKAVA